MNTKEKIGKIWGRKITKKKSERRSEQSHKVGSCVMVRYQYVKLILVVTIECQLKVRVEKLKRK